MAQPYLSLSASRRPMRAITTAIALVSIAAGTASPQGTRLLRNPSLGPTQIAFTYGGDLWVVGRQGGEARRLTSTPAVETDPHCSPDGKWIAFTSNRDGGDAVYVVSADGGDPRRLTWSTAGEHARGWTPLWSPSVVRVRARVRADAVREALDDPHRWRPRPARARLHGLPRQLLA